MVRMITSWSLLVCTPASARLLATTLHFACLIDLPAFFFRGGGLTDLLNRFFDTSKQGFANIIVHFVNVFASTWMSGVTRDKDPCTWYIVGGGERVCECVLRATDMQRVRTKETLLPLDLDPTCLCAGF